MALYKRTNARVSILSHIKRWQAGDDGLKTMHGRLCAFACWVHSGLCMIRDNSQQIVPMKFNRSQRRLLALMLDQAEKGKPVRVKCGKARKTGISTFIQCLGVFLCWTCPNQYALTLAHEDEATAEIFAIAKRCAKEIPGSTVIHHEIRFDGNGSHYRCQTGGARAVGAGGTPSLLHLSEGAKWSQAAKDEQYNARSSVPDDPNTIIVEESTFKQRERFWDEWEAASKNEWHPYVSLFIPWFIDDRLTIADHEPLGELDEYERWLVGYTRKHGVELSHGQLAWRRMKQQAIGEQEFAHEYPATPEEAIQANKGLLFPRMRDWLFTEDDGLPFDPVSTPHSERSGGIDFGFHDPTVILGGFYRDRTIYVTTYYRRAQGVAADHVAAIEQGHTYWCDPADAQARYELQAKASQNGIVSWLAPAPRSVNDLKADQTADEWKQVIKMGAEGRIRIAEPVAQQLLVEADSFEWDEKTGKPNDKRTPQCGHFDSLNALKYWVMGVLSREFAEPPSVKRPSHGTRRQMWKV